MDNKESASPRMSGIGDYREPSSSRLFFYREVVSENLSSGVW